MLINQLAAEILQQVSVDANCGALDVSIPVGNLTGSQVIHFNSQMVQKVVHLGYEDEQDSAYVYLTKQEYILQKGKRSYEFASKEEGRKLREKMEGRDVEGNKN